MISAYLALARSQERGALSDDTPPRPAGPVVWAVCATQAHLAAVQTLSRKLADDGEDITVIATCPDSDSHPATPNTRRTTAAFLGHWRPQLVIWIGASLDPAVVLELGQSQTPCLLVEADTNTIKLTSGSRIPRLIGKCLRVFDQIFTVNNTATARLIKAGAPASKTHTKGRLEDGAIPPAYDENARAELTTALVARPMWLAADLPLSEVEIIINAYRHAARRAHRTLLILAPRNISDTSIIAQMLRDDGLVVAERAKGDAPRDATQIYITTDDHGLGLWCRLSPITYLGGSFSDGQVPDPFTPAMVGSAVLSGPCITTAIVHFGRLVAENAVARVSTPDGLGRAIESLLATDQAALQAHAAWDVTSRGADTTNELVAIIYDYLDQVDS